MRSPQLQISTLEERGEGETEPLVVEEMTRLARLLLRLLLIVVLILAFVYKYCGNTNRVFSRLNTSRAPVKPRPFVPLASPEH